MLATQRIGFLERLHSPARPVLVFDGATGTSLQQMDLTADDFGGLALEGCNENLVFTRPDAVQAVHRQFLQAGCDVIETDDQILASGLSDLASAFDQLTLINTALYGLCIGERTGDVGAADLARRGRERSSWRVQELIRQLTPSGER